MGEDKFHKKHPPLKDGNGGSFVGKEDANRKKKTVSQAMAEMDEARKRYNLDMAVVEKNLTEYLEIADPVVVDGKDIFWVRRPSMLEIKDLTPTKEQMKFMENPKAMPTDLQKEYDDRFYKKVSVLIVAPKKTPDEWREAMNPWLLRLFWGYMAKIGNILGAEIEGF